MTVKELKEALEGLPDDCVVAKEFVLFKDGGGVLQLVMGIKRYAETDTYYNKSYVVLK